jgi:hypothetical protein
LRPAPIKIRLADGKERSIQSMTATTFWSPEGRPMSAAEFIQRLFGDLPALFKDEDELRALWSEPQTRRRSLGVWRRSGDRLWGFSGFCIDRGEGLGVAGAVALDGHAARAARHDGGGGQLVGV